MPPPDGSAHYTLDVPISRDQAFLLKRSPYGESSLVAHLLTREHGRVHVIAKGAFRATSRFFCVLDFFHTLDLEWSDAPRRELGLLRAGALATRRRRIPLDLGRYRAAAAMLELAELAARPGQADAGLFDLLCSGLDDLELAATATGPELALVVFELGFLQNLGLSPALDACAACAGPAEPVTPGRAAFSAGAGGRLCRACAEDARRSGRRVGTLPVVLLEAARELAGTDAEQRARLRPPRELIDRMRDFIERFLDFHLETRPRSHRVFLAVPNRNAPEAGPVAAWKELGA